VKKFDDFNGIFFFGGLMNYERVDEDLAGFFIFEVVDDYMIYCYFFITGITYWCWFVIYEI